MKVDDKFNQLLASISPETFARLLLAVETGRWPDGVLLTAAQREQSMQLVIAYQAKYKPGDEPFSVGADGQLVTKTKQEIKQQMQTSTPGKQDIARFKLHDQASD